MQKLIRPFANQLYTVNTFSTKRFFAIIHKYTPSHEWIKYDDQTKEGAIGISDFAQSELGDIVHVDLPSLGKKLKAKESALTIESVKSTADVYSPLAGEISAVNGNVSKDIASINKNAEDTWLVKIKVTDASELNNLLSKEDYLKTIKK